MILGDMVGMAAESRGGNAAGQGVTYAPRRPSRTRLGTPQTPFSREDPDPWRDDHMAHDDGNGEGAKALTGLRSGDGPLSVRVRPSSLKHDCDRRATSTSEKHRVTVHAKSRLTPEPLRTLRPETKGQAGACPDRTRAIPCTVQAVTIQQPSTATTRTTTSSELSPTPSVSWHSGQPPSTAATSGRRGPRAISHSNQRSTTATKEHQGVQLSGPDGRTPYTFQAGDPAIYGSRARISLVYRLALTAWRSQRSPASRARHRARRR